MFRLYYWAANAKALMFWQQGTLSRLASGAPLWLNMEANTIANTIVSSSLSSMLFSKLEKPGSLKKCGFILRNCQNFKSDLRYSVPTRDLCTNVNLINHSFLPFYPFTLTVRCNLPCLEREVSGLVTETNRQAKFREKSIGLLENHRVVRQSRSR